MNLWKVPIPTELLSVRLHVLRRKGVAVTRIKTTRFYPNYNALYARPFPIECEVGLHYYGFVLNEIFIALVVMAGASILGPPLVLFLINVLVQIAGLFL